VLDSIGFFFKLGKWYVQLSTEI